MVTAVDTTACDCYEVDLGNRLSYAHDNM
jgi:hypothetical protein